MDQCILITPQRIFTICVFEAVWIIFDLLSQGFYDCVVVLKLETKQRENLVYYVCDFGVSETLKQKGNENGNQNKFSCVSG